MTRLKSIPFPFDGREFEIRVDHLANEIKVRVFLDDKPANPWSYSVDYPVADDFANITGEQAWTHLVAIAKSDVETRRLETIREAMTEERTKQQGMK